MELAPREQVGVKISVADSDPMAEAGTGTTTPELAAERPLKTKQPEPFPMKLNSVRPLRQNIPKEQLREMDESEDATLKSQINFNETINSVLADKSIQYDEDTLRTDMVFQESARRLSEFLGDQIQPMTTGLFDKGPVDTGTEGERQAQYGLDLYSELISNLGGVSMEQQRLGGTVPVLSRVIDSGDLDTQLAALYVMEMGDRKDITLTGAGRAIKHMVGDLTNYIGLATMPVLVGKFAARGAIKAASKTALQDAIKKTVQMRGVAALATPTAKAAGMGATEGGSLLGVEDLMRQHVEVAAGRRDGIDMGQVARSFGLGAVLGGAVTGAAVKIPETIVKAINSIPTSQGKAKMMYNWFRDTALNIDPIDPALVERATKGDQFAAEQLAGAVYSRNYERVIGENTSDKLQPMVLKKLQENPNLVESIAKQYGFEFEYFSANPNSIGREVGGKKVQLAPVGNKNLKKQGYDSGTIWVYDPTDTHGSFSDPEYTKAWRQVHELAHALTEKYMQDKYGDSRRFGAMSFDRRNPYSDADKRTYKALSLAEAQRAIEWEDVAFRTQVKLIERMGIPVDAKQATDDWNIAALDTLVRATTGDFADPGMLGVKLGPNDAPVQTIDALRFLENQEKANAKYQRRKPTMGTNLDNWQPISDADLEHNLDTWKKTSTPKKVTMSVETTPGQSTPASDFATRLSANPELQKAYHDEVTPIVDDMIKESGLKVSMKHDVTQGVWLGESNPVTQYDVVIPKGGTTPEFQKQMSDLTHDIAVILNQDGVGWHKASFVETPTDTLSSDLNGVYIDAGRSLSKDEMLFLDDELRARYGDTFFLASTDDGVKVIDWETGKGYNKGIKLHDDIMSIIEDFDTDETMTIGQFNAVSGTEEPNWKGLTDGTGKKSKGTSKGTQGLLRQSDNKYSQKVSDIQAKYERMMQDGTGTKRESGGKDIGSR